MTHITLIYSGSVSVTNPEGRHPFIIQNNLVYNTFRVEQILLFLDKYDNKIIHKTHIYKYF